MTLTDDDYEITSRHNYTGQKTSVLLRDYINWTTDKKKKRGKTIFWIFLLIFYFLTYKNFKNGFWKSHWAKTVFL